MAKKKRVKPVVELQGTVLGLDLGSNSIGWALIDQQHEKIIAAGSRIFPEGVDRDQKGGELSKNESRRVARGMRRQIRRRAQRKRRLRDALIAVGLLPTDPAEQAKLDTLNPYELRRRALDQKITPHEFGRVLVHLNQRRGFLSNRKSDKEKEASEMLAEISELAKQQEEAGHRTIGEHFAAKYAANPLERIRGKHTRRQMFLAEFEALWKEQAKHYPNLLTNQLKLGTEGIVAYPRTPLQSAGGVEELLRRFGLFGIIFFQRPIDPPSSMVGKCELNPKEKRCPRADRAAQKFRIFQEVNNLRIIDGGGEVIELTSDQRKKLLAYLAKSKEVSFDQIRKKLKLLESVGFNLEAGKRKGLLGMTTDAMLAGKKVYGESWHELAENLKDGIVRSLIHDEEDVFLERARVEWKMDRDMAERLLKVNLPEGCGSLGRETIERLLPYIEKGLPLMTRDSTPCAIRMAGFLAPWERTIKTGQFLPEPPDLTNPIVRQALYEVRKLINAVVREYGRPSAIHIEMAREIKGSATYRKEIGEAMREREARRNRAADEIRKEGFKPTRESIDMFLLWAEQSKVCMYSGKSIGITKLFGGDVAIDHILPYSQSLDDSLMNKVVCLRDENDAKGQRTPYEWLAQQNPQKYDQVLQRASRLPMEIRNRKRPRFAQKTCELTQFINRQLTDTAYITSAVVDYVKGLGVQVLGTKGQLTAELRHQWGLNDVLRDDGLNLKNREDHRHHAIDAILVALTDQSRLQELARARGIGKEMKRPWGNFRKDVETAINAINVSHRARRKVAGALHEETIYGPTPNAGEFVYRKPVEALTPGMIEDIRDPTIRQILTEHLAKFGVTAGGKGKIPAEAWKHFPRMASGVVIKKVRLIRRDQTIRKLAEDREAFVKPGSTHHIVLFELPSKKGKVQRELIAVSMLEATQRLKNGEAVVQRAHPTNPEARFVLSLSQNEMVLLEHKGNEGLYRFDTAASTSGQMWFRYHTAGGKSAEKLGEASKKPNTIIAKKVTVDVLGRIRWAND
jgi:CRISPR-associated endonuclease Csn1